MEFLKNLSVYLILFIIVAIPSFFWVRWAIRSHKNKREFDFIIASSSSFLFISGWMVITLAPAKYFKHNASESAMLIYKYFATSLLLSVFILILYVLVKVTSLSFRRMFLSNVSHFISKITIKWMKN